MCNQCSSLANIDNDKQNEFAGKMLNVLNYGSLGMMISVGHRTHLFDTLANLPAATSDEIAQAASLNERYVREWLGAMVTGEIVEYFPENKTYHLPPEHASFLTRNAKGDNLAVPTQFLSVLGSVEDEIVECFKYGGGVPYSKYPRFHEVMAEESTHSVVESLESNILPLIDGLQDRLSAGIRVLDVGCGRGRAILSLAKKYPKSSFVGIDLSSDAIAYANAQANSEGLKNVTFLEMDVSNFHETAEMDAFDFVTTFDSIHDQAQPENVLAGIRRTLKSDGVYLMQDINGTSHVDQDKNHPLGPMLYTISCMHCMTVSLAANGAGLGAMWGEEVTRKYLALAGFGSIITHRLEHDIMNNWYTVTV